ncbi:alpha/beta hydrolase [Streptomyces sp. NPDC020141]|uniref:alpha/beta hydrolase n=1 Tax=Streptomyces sp. NPDC020141 TaxID=3365065 RepID=UPI0037A2288D
MSAAVPRSGPRAEFGEERPALSVRRSPTRPRAAVLLLHGGREDGLEAPPLLNLPAARMRPFAAAIARATPLDEVAVAEVRYRHRGWNGPRADPVHDARRALHGLLGDTESLPVVLVGHSMGARAALRLAGDPRVHGVVALAPWWPPDESVAGTAGRRLIALHDEHDRVTAARNTWELLARARRAGAHTLGVRMPSGGHAMLRDARTWHRVATALTLGLLGLAPLPAALNGDGAYPAGEPQPSAPPKSPLTSTTSMPPQPSVPQSPQSPLSPGEVLAEVRPR